MRTVVKVEGMEALRRTLRGLATEFPGLVRKSIRLRAELIMTDSKQNYVPVRDGHLKNSGHVVMMELPAIGVILGFGGPAGIGTNRQGVGYAVIQHENTSFHHNVGEDHYLLKPLNAATSHLARDIAGDVHVDKWRRDPKTGRFLPKGKR